MNAATLDVSAPSEGMLQLILAQAVSPGRERDRGDRRSEAIRTGEAAQEALMARLLQGWIPARSKSQMSRACRGRRFAEAITGFPLPVRVAQSPDALD